MRFLDTTTCQFVEADPRNVDYAILSHTWDPRGEQKYEELRRIQEQYVSKADTSTVPGVPKANDGHSPTQLDAVAHDYAIWNNSHLSPKIRYACTVARKYGFRLIWIDSCCIDKTSSSELSEAINSMYAWYAAAQVCYAYLVDVDPGDNHSAEKSQFRGSIWFKRGWTLQELIAPYEVIMLSKDWGVMGSKRDLVDVIEQITGISACALLHEEPLGKFSVSQRLSWASYRQTTRVEDRAYSLLGIFDINIPTLYGEGERAFRRLQEAIMERIPDQTLFAWGSICDFPDVLEALLELKEPGRSSSFECFETLPVTSILAPSPIDFSSASSVTAVPHDEVHDRLKISNHSPPEYTSTPHGIRTQLPVIRLDRYLPPSTTTVSRSEYSLSDWYLVILACRSSSSPYPGSLIGSVCYIPSSKSGLNFLYCGIILHKNSGVRSSTESELRKSSSANLFPLSSTIIERCRAEIALKVVYIAHPNPVVSDWTSQTAVTATQSLSLSKPPLKTIYLSMTRNARERLRTTRSGYVVDSIELRGALSGDDPATTYWVVKLAGELGHSITAEYRFIQTDQGFSIRRRITTDTRAGEHTSVREVPLFLDGSRHNRSKPDRDFRFLPYNSLPAKALLPQEVVITTPDAKSRTLTLRLNFERWSSFTLDIDVSAPREASIPQPQLECSQKSLSLNNTGVDSEDFENSGTSTHMTRSAIPNSNAQGVMTTDLEEIHDGITEVISGLPGLLKILDEVGQIHPLIRATTRAFRAALELQFKHRDNDKMLLLLFEEMKNMMTVLVQLQDISQDKRAGEGNMSTILERMKPLIEETVEDIKSCANMCDTYTKRTRISKVMHRASWNELFERYIQIFAGRRREFMLAMSMDIRHAVNTANDKPATTKKQMGEHDTSYYMSPDHGGPDGVTQGKNVFHKLFKSHAVGRTDEFTTEPKAQFKDGVVHKLRELRKEMQEDVQALVRDNMEQFGPKFVIQQRELEERERQTMYREGDRDIHPDMAIAEPHREIIDSDIHAIWKKMCWGGSVNLRDQHFVFALRDHFREKQDKNDAVPTVPSTDQRNNNDDWTLEYLNATTIQPIIEAFNDDALGSINVVGVNTFTTTRPRNWSLPRWIAYWAFGHQMSMSNYAAKIDSLLANMSALKTYVLPDNRNAMEQYLCTVWPLVTMLTTAFRRIEVDKQLLYRFEDYTQDEEKRLSENLRTVKFHIDTQDTLDLIRGQGRIEKHVFPLLYLLLKRDFEIMRLARTQCLQADELGTSIRSIMWVFDAINQRHNVLADLFKQQKLDLSEQFKIFAFEMFKYWHDEEHLSLKVHEPFLAALNDDGTKVQEDDLNEELFHTQPPPPIPRML